jgi:hypothetical protein
MWIATLLWAWTIGNDDLVTIENAAFAKVAATATIEFESACTTQSKLRIRGEVRPFRRATHLKFISDGNSVWTEVKNRTSPTEDPVVMVFDGRRSYIRDRLTGHFSPVREWFPPMEETWNPLVTPYVWLADSKVDLNWPRVKKEESWTDRFREARYQGTEGIPLGDCHVVIFPNSLMGTDTVYFLLDGDCFPVCMERKDTAGKLRAVTDVTELTAVDINGTTFRFPKEISNQVWDESAEPVINGRIVTDSFTINPSIDRRIFKVP